MLCGDYRLLIAKNGEEALVLATRQRVALVLLDMEMPVLDGFEAAPRMRALPGGDHIPIVAMTAHNTERDREKCLESGMDDYASKPVDPEKLQEILERWVVRTASASRR